jgi:DNA modification methylase
MAEKLQWETKKVPLSSIKEFEHNPRQLTKKQYQDLKKSLQKFDYVEVAAIDYDNTLIAGHQRLRVLRDLKGDDIEIDVRFPNRKLTEKEFKEYLVRSNKNTGDWDYDVLANTYEIGELIEYGFTEEELQVNEAEYIEEDETEGDDDIPEKAPALTVKGDLYQLGGHRLLCGDSTMIDDVEKLMDGEKAVLAHNDPPYGMKKEKDGVENDNLNYDALLEFNKEWINLQFLFLEDNGSWYCWGIDEPLMDIYSHILKPLIKTQKATFRNLITWDKGSAFGRNSEEFRSYPISDEKCLFVMCGVQGINDYADNYFEGWDVIREYIDEERKKIAPTRKEYEKILGSKNKSQHHFSKSHFHLITEIDYNKLRNYAKELNINAFKKEYDEIKKDYYSTRAYFNNTHDSMSNVWDIQRTSQEERKGTGGHATPKPLELCSRVIMSSSQEGDIVTDWFLGSGSTLIACEKLNRKCYGLELSEKYCDVIVKRYVEFCKKNNKKYEVIRNGEKCNDFE